MPPAATDGSDDLAARLADGLADDRVRLDEADVVTRLRAAGCVFAEDEARLLVTEAGTPAELAGMVDRRTAGIPLEHILGWAEFAGLRIAVDEGVFVPRRRSELLVREAARRAGAGAVIVDMCCGSGAVGVALVAALGAAELHAVDVDAAAARCAVRNVAPYGGQVHVGDLDAPLPATLLGRVDIIVANTPYVPTDAIAQMPLEARLHEPRVALDGGADGLVLHRRLAEAATRWLRPGGHLLVETSVHQSPRTAEILGLAGFTTWVVHDEDLDGTVVVGTSSA